MATYASGCNHTCSRRRRLGTKNLVCDAFARQDVATRRVVNIRVIQFSELSLAKPADGTAFKVLTSAFPARPEIGTTDIFLTIRVGKMFAIITEGWRSGHFRYCLNNYL